MTATTARGLVKEAMTRATEAANDAPPSQTRAHDSVAAAGSWGELRIDLASDTARVDYLIAVANLFRSVATGLVAVDHTGHARSDLNLDEIGQLLRVNRIAEVRLDVNLAGAPGAIAMALNGDPAPSSVSLSVPLGSGLELPATLWLQANAERSGPLHTVAVPIRRGAFTADALHAFVAIAARKGAFVRAQLFVDREATPHRTWSAEHPAPGAHAVCGSHADSVWRLDATAEPAGTPVAWSAGREPPPQPASAPAEWWTKLGELTNVTPSLEALTQHLRAAFPSAPAWRLVDIASAPPARLMTPAEDQAIATLVPTETEVLVAVDLRQPSAILAATLAHCLAHVTLGHVRAGDRWGHWDTVKTVMAESPHRVWDREASDHAAASLGRQPARRVESLDQCTPNEKAQLGLWRLIGEMLGEGRRLHPEADRYQQAAYQRQAAQRLVSMLEDFGGAMLCDGVGLGKTYVATTLLAHYANTWRDAWAATPDRFTLDPFRITILAPHSVVSTWRREALPGLAAFGVPLATVRVISHTRLSRVSPSSELLEPLRGAPSDLEHLLLSDLVIVDEAHNLRSLAARRTKVLRDLLRIQPRRELRRKVALLTATPINNSLDDLRQEVSLLFSRPLLLSDAKTDDGYRRQAIKEIQDRCVRARAAKTKGDIAALIIHGQAEAKFSDVIEFRDDLNFGPNVPRIGDYLKEQDKRLKELQDDIRAAAQREQPGQGHAHVRIAEDLLDRIVVQRSRALCKDIEEQQGSRVELLFRPDAGAPEKLHYSDEYDGIEDVLAGFLPLFNTAEDSAARSAQRPLSFKIYMWYDVREALKSPEDTSSVIGLQRVLVLKRLESSPVSFLLTLVRLAVLHAHRLVQLGELCLAAADQVRQRELTKAIHALLGRQDEKALAKLRSLATGDSSTGERAGFLKSLSAAYAADRPAADTDDAPPQLTLFAGDTKAVSSRTELDRLWPLREAILDDFETLLAVTPGLADIVFGKFEQREWPRRFIAGGEAVDWPTSAAWGLRLVTDAKLRQLIARLVTARRAGQKVVVFSQFSDTIAYIQSVLRACASFSRSDWQMVVRGGLGVARLRSEELTGLLAATTTVTGDTEDRDEVVNAFAPFYRIGPIRPSPPDTADADRRLLDEAWEASWTGAILRPIDVLLSTDVLAEGVNLQDAALLINFDVHWNPVRMIQRAGRIDRRLNPRIEHARDLSDLAALAARLGRPVPRYYWHDHPGEPPVTVNMILPDELEAELLLRERIATKTLAIDFTLGLEQGTGAEADWMESYTYQGITSLNSLQRDRAIEQIAGHHERLSRLLKERGIRPEWGENLNGWFRAARATPLSPLVGRALLGRRGGELERFSRYLEPAERDGVPFWFWAEKRPGESMFDGWLVLDGRPENFPPHPRRDIPFHENVASPLRAAHLLGAAEYLAGDSALDALPGRDIGRLLMQGGSALAAPKLGTEEDRRLIALRDFFILQLPSFESAQESIRANRFPTIPPTSAREPASNGARL